MTRRRKVAIVTILSVAGFLGIAIVLEGGARLLGFQARSVRRYSWLRKFDPVIGWTYKPDAKFQFATSRGVIHGSTDGEGFRPLVSGANDPDSPVVLCLGDSFTFAAESPDDRTWPESLSRALAIEGKPWRALNRGVTGYSPLQILEGLRRTLARDPRASKIRAVVYLYCFNDPQENFEENRPHFEPADRPETLAALKAGQPKVIPPVPSHPERLRSPVRWLRDSSAFLNAVRPEKAELTDEAFREGAKATSAYFTPMFPNFLQKEAFQEGMRYVLRELKRECDARGLPLLVASTVVPALDDPAARREFAANAGWSASQEADRLAAYHASFELLKKMVGEAGAGYVELRGCLAGLAYRECVASSEDFHFSVDTNARIGKVLADRLTSLPAPRTGAK